MNFLNDINNKKAKAIADLKSTKTTVLKNIVNPEIDLKPKINTKKIDEVKINTSILMVKPKPKATARKKVVNRKKKDDPKYASKEFKPKYINYYPVNNTDLYTELKLLCKENDIEIVNEETMINEGARKIIMEQIELVKISIEKSKHSNDD